MAGGFCDKLEKPYKPRKKIKYFPRKAVMGRRRTRGSSDRDTDLTVRHFGSYGDMCAYPLTAPLPNKVSTAEDYSYIIDTTGLIQNEWNPVEHIRYKGVITIPPFTLEISPYPALTVAPDNLAFSVFDGIHAHIPKPDDNQMDDLAAMSLNHFRNAVDNVGESLATFFRELYQSVQGNIKALSKYATLWEKCQRVYEEAYERYLQRGHSGAASAWLAWNFSIKANIGDLRRLLCSFHRARLRFEWLRQRNRKPTKVKFRKRDCFNPEAPVVIYDYVPTRTYYSDLTIPCVNPPASVVVEFESYLELTKINYNLDYHAVGFVLFTIPSWVFDDVGKGQAIVWLAQEGFTNPVKIAWNTIPYSWIVDWFVSFRTHLQEQSLDLSPLKDADIVYNAHSFKLTSTWLVEHVYWDDLGEHRNTCGTISYDSYARHIGLPISSENPFRVPWSGYNLSIIAALVSQWWRRRHGRRR